MTFRRLGGIVAVMAWWITVYCRGDCSNLSATDLLAGVRGEDSQAPSGVDYVTLAEEYGVDDALVAPAIADLRTTSDFEIYYGTDRPVVLHLWTTPDLVGEETAEAREVRAPPPEAEPWLSQCQSIVGLELGFSMLEDMGIVIAYEAARFLAQKYDGVIVDDEGTWQGVEGGGFVPLGEGS